jgi:YbbR domain-containing protein
MPIILHQNFTKIAAILIGYSIWFFITNFTWTTVEYQVPVCFYHTEQQTIQAPETVLAKITGPSSMMHQLHQQNLGLHIDISKYSTGKHEILLYDANLFLPEPLKLIELIPATIFLNISPT